LIGETDIIYGRPDPVNFPNWYDYVANPNLKCFGQWNASHKGEFGYAQKNDSYVMATGSAPCYTVRSCTMSNEEAKLVKVTNKDGHEFWATRNFRTCIAQSGNNINVPLATWQKVSKTHCYMENGLPPP
jgi:hypothetical protein